MLLAAESLFRCVDLWRGNGGDTRFTAFFISVSRHIDFSRQRWQSGTTPEDLGPVDGTSVHYGRRSADKSRSPPHRPLPGPVHHRLEYHATPFLFPRIQKQKRTLQFKYREDSEEVDADKSPTEREDVTEKDVEASSPLPFWNVAEDKIPYDDDICQGRRLKELSICEHPCRLFTAISISAAVDRHCAAFSCTDDSADEKGDGDTMCLPINDAHVYVNAIIDGNCVATGMARSERLARRRAASLALRVLGVAAEDIHTDSVDPHST